MSFLYIRKRKNNGKADRKGKLKDVNETCILCRCDTGVRLTMPVSERAGFMPGLGQLCSSCYREVAESLAADARKWID